MQAKTKEQYIRAWQRYVNELASVALDLGTLAAFEAFQSLQRQANDLIQQAADTVFPNG